MKENTVSHAPASCSRIEYSATVVHSDTVGWRARKMSVAITLERVLQRDLIIDVVIAAEVGQTDIARKCSVVEAGKQVHLYIS